MHFKLTVSDVASGAAVAILVVGVIVAVALIIHGRRDPARYLTARENWIAFGNIVASVLAISFIAAMSIPVVVLAVPHIPWLLAAVSAIIAVPSEAVWNWFTDQSLSEQLLIVAIVMTSLIVGAIKKAADRVIAAIAMIEADRRRH